MKDVDKLFVYLNNTVYEALEAIQNGHVEIALVVDEENRLIGTVTDGDIRRALLSGVEMGDRVDKLLHQREHAYQKPTTGLVGLPVEELLQVMREKTLRHIPLLDDEGRVVELAWISELIEDVQLPLSAVVMAGGFGTRLMPLTENIPKPMLPVGDKPLLERTIERLRQAGIRRVNLTTHYKKEMIADYFGNGQDFGVDIRYLEEDKPLGTAGALCLLEAQDEPILVINGDIVSQIDFGAMMSFHRHHEADMTVAVRQYKLAIPYGVIEFDGVNISGLSEKPTVSHFVNAGVYLLNPELCDCVPKNQAYDMTDLINQSIVDKKRVIGFPLHEYWLDIGQPADYELAKTHGEKKGED